MNIARAVIDAFDKLPKKGKPLIRNNGDPEWTVLAGIVLELDNDQYECVCTATGLKSTPNNILSQCNGQVLHDMHAEVLAIRAFNRFLLEEYGNSKYFDGPKFKPKVHMYVSEAPCGDSSMGLMNEGVEYIWMDDLVRIGDENSPVSGRDHFHRVGLVRTKPGKRTAARTFSKSCSDKLALKQCTSLLMGSVAKVLSEPVYLSTLVIPESRFVAKDFVRAFRSRIKSDHYFEFQPVSISFRYERKKSLSVPCPHSLVWVKSHPPEAILNGVKMGNRPLKSGSKGASLVCRESIAKLALKHGNVSGGFESYVEWKSSASRRAVKQKAYKDLGHWLPTAEDDFCI